MIPGEKRLKRPKKQKYKKAVLTPQALERRERLKDALRFCRFDTMRDFCAQAEINVTTIWRWVLRGDPTSLPRSGARVVDAEHIAEKLGLSGTYLQLGGPRLF